jgi:hypothetical protein
MLMIAMLLAAGTPQPWVGMSAGPVMLRESGRSGVGAGPLVRVEVGYPLADRLAAEIWLTTAIENAPRQSPGDRAVMAAGGGARLLVARLDSEGRMGLWLHGGAGWGVPVAGEGQHGPSGFGGALLTFQPFTKRFTLGLEADAVAWRNLVGLAILPSLRCTF